jgi:hypothetical protein
MRVFTSVLLFAMMLGCAAPRTTVRTDDQSGSVVFKVKPSNAIVWVDGRQVGPARSFDGSSSVLKLPPGIHIIGVTAPGRAPYETKIYLSDSQELIQVELPPEAGQ